MEDNERNENTPEQKEFQHPKDAAEHIYNEFSKLISNHSEKTTEWAIAFEDVLGLLDGIMEQRITRGQPRLMLQLTRVCEGLATEDAKREMAELIGDCASYGLTAEGQDLTAPYRGHSHVNSIKK